MSFAPIRGITTPPARFVSPAYLERIHARLAELEDQLKLFHLTPEQIDAIVAERDRLLDLLRRA